jgi:tetratricopeptide (TPR) repeat protein
MGKEKTKAQELKKTETHALLERRMFWSIGILALLVYFTTISFGFVLDDVAVISENEHVKKGFGGLPEILSTFYWDGYWAQGSGLFRPLSLVMFAMEYALSPDNPLIHHAVNVLLYAFTCMLAFRVFRKLLPDLSLWALFGAVLFFTLHPAHTEVVANIKSRDEILALLFFLLTCFFLFCQENFRRKHLFLGGLSFFLALLSKESVLLFLPILFVLAFYRHPGRTGRIRVLIPSLVTVLWFAWYYTVVSHSPDYTYTYQDNSILASSSFVEQFSTALSIFSLYVVKAFYPFVLSYDYSFSQIPLANPGSLLTIMGAALLLLSLWLGIRALRKKSLAWVLGLSMLVLPLLLSSHLLMPIGVTFADRLLFAPSLGMALLLGLAYNYSATRFPAYLRMVQGVLALLCVLFLVQTFQRNKAWESNASLFTTDLRHSPESARVHFNYGTLLMGPSGGELTPAQVKEALDEFNICLALDSNYRDAYTNKGLLLLNMEDYPKAVAHYTNALKRFEANPEFLGGLGEAYYKMGNKEAAREALQAAWEAGNRHAGVYTIGSTLEFEDGAYDIAEEMLKEGLKRYPDNANLLTNMGNTLAIQKRYKEAIEHFEKARIIQPSNMDLLRFIGMCYDALGDSTQTQRYYDAWQKSQ